MFSVLTPTDRMDVAGRDVPMYLVNDTASTEWFIEQIGHARTSGLRVALDTETYGWTDTSNGTARVLSACWENADGLVAAVIDLRDVDVAAVADALAGLPAYGWNATFDARVTEDCILEERTPIDWWDGMLADAVLHQGKTGFEFFHGLALVARRMCGIILDGKGTTQVSFTADGDLSEDQVRYAALDAVATLLVCRELEVLLHQENLSRACELEQEARPFLDRMERYGIPIDWEGWTAYLANLQGELDTALDRLAQLTGGGQPDIFSGLERPFWNPDSTDDVKRIFNETETARVNAHFKATTGSERLFGKIDKADKDTLKELGGELSEALREYKDLKKILSTYGEGLAKWVGEDGRMHPQYLQVIGTDTGRLSSRRPNAQNFTPKLKPFFRPPAGTSKCFERGTLIERTLDGQDGRRVFVYADLSQAELRDLAHESADEGLLGGFRAGKDIHVATAERMFGVDMTELKESDPKAFKAYRSKAKTLNFGIVYGLGPKALARSLSLSGVPTSVDEAKGLLKAYLDAYPGVRVWLETRDRFVRELAANPPEIDWTATLLLKDLYGPIKSVSGQFKKANGRDPDDEELCGLLYGDSEVREQLAAQLGRDPSPQEITAERQRRTDAVGWVRTFDGPVVVCSDGSPFMFASFTQSGRRRQFNVATDSLLLAMCTVAAQSPKDGARTLRDRFAALNGVKLAERNGRGLDRDELTKVFEDRELRRSFINYLEQHAPASAFRDLLRKALGDRISAMGNAYRNAPIQGGVADVALAAYGDLQRRLARFDRVWPVQTVHDSITLECDEADAEAVAKELKDALESAMSALCPTVPAVADADVRTSLDDRDVVCEI